MKEKNNKKCNKFNKKALSEAERNIMYANYTNQPASDDFRQELKAKILEQRRKKSNMKKLNLAKIFNFRYFVPAVSLVLIIAVVFASMQFLFHDSEPVSPLGKVSRLIINSAYAHDNFQVEPTESDSMGIYSKSQFVVKSQQKIDLETLRKSITLSPAIDFQIEKINDHEFKVVPKEELNENKVYNLQIAASYIAQNGKEVASDYSWAFQVRNEFKILSSLPRDKSNQVPVNTGIEIKFSHLGFENHVNAFSIDPKIEGSFEVHKNDLVFVPKKDLDYGTIYTVKIDKDKLELEGSEEKLRNNFEFSFETLPKEEVIQRDYHSFNFNDDFVDFSTSVNPFLGVRGVEKNATISLELRAFNSPDDFISAVNQKLKYPYWSYKRQLDLDLSNYNLSEVGKYDLPVVKNDDWYYSYLVVLPEELPKGYYLAKASSGKEDNDQILIQITDYAVFAQVMKDETLFWVNDIDSDQPVADASIEVIGNGMKEKTNQDGVALFNTREMIDPELGDYYFKVTKGENISILNFTERFRDSAEKEGNYYSGFNLNPVADIGSKYWKYIASDRQIYKTTDEINVWGTILPRSDEMEKMDTMQIKLCKSGNYYDIYNNEICAAVEEVNVREDGVFEGKLSFEGILPGHYALQLIKDDVYYAGKYITVEDYVKPAYTFESSPQADYVYAGDPIKVDIKASFFEGTPLANLDLEVEGEIVKTDSQGQVTYIKNTTFKDCDISSSNCHYPRYDGIYIDPAQQEFSDINDYVSVRVLGAKLTSRVFFDREKENPNKAKIKVLAADLDIDKLNSGEEKFPYLYSDSENRNYDPAENKKVKGRIIKKESQKIVIGQYYDYINKVTRDKYKYVYNDIEIGTFEGVTNKNGEFIYDLDVDPEGRYVVNVTVEDDNGRHDATSGYLSFKSFSRFFLENRYQIKLMNDDEYFSLGEEVVAEFSKGNERTPIHERDAYLYMRLQNGLMGYDVTDNSEYRFIFGEEHVPNVYLAGVYFDGETYHMSKSNNWLERLDGTNILYDYEDKELRIDISTDKNEYKPGEKAKVFVTVKNNQGKPVKASLSVNLVDEAIFKISRVEKGILQTLYANLRTGSILNKHTHDYPDTEDNVEGGGCFLHGTKILMADGSLKNIEDIVEGDKIMTFKDMHSGELVSGEVSNTFKHIVSGYYIINDKLKITPEHMVYLNGSWDMIGNAKIGDLLRDKDNKLVVIEKIDKVEEIVPVYNITVDKYHTYIADGIYVHNDKGGTVRSVFKDTAFTSKNVATDANGKAEVELELPDNLTSWRIIAKAFTENVEAGISWHNIDVSLPAFVKTDISDEYLLDDKPVLRLRAYGKELSAQDKVSFTVETPDFKPEKIVKQANAYKDTYAQIDKLILGASDVKVSLESLKGNDAILKKVNVIESRLTKEQQDFYELNDDVIIQGSRDGETKLIITDKSMGQYYYDLRKLSRYGGQRVDQKLSNVLASDLLSRYYEIENNSNNQIRAINYQLKNGGISLLPYSDSELELSARVAALNTDYFDKVFLKKYFYEFLQNSDSNQDEIVMALYGLASLEEPVLLQIQYFSEVEQLTVKDKLYLGLAAYEIGSYELAKELYDSVVRDYVEDLSPYKRIAFGEDEDDYMQLTALAALLGGGLNKPEAPVFWDYVVRYQTKDILLNLEKLNYLQNTLPNLIPSEVSFDITINGETYHKELAKGKMEVFRLNPEQLASVQFSNISGEIGIVSQYDKKFDIETVDTSDYVSVQKSYYNLQGQKITEFDKDDLIEVRLNVNIKKNAIAGAYEIVDFLPSGMKSMTELYKYNDLSKYRIDYSKRPIEIDGQKIKFILYQGQDKQDYPTLNYYAKVLNPGEYVSEPAVIQSLSATDIMNYSDAGKVKINY